jgi:hypothetical protein
MRKHQQPSDNVFAEFLVALRTQVDEQQGEKLEQLRKLFAAATVNSPALFHRFDESGYCEGKQS